MTSGGSGKRFEIQLGHLCNNRCVFCSSGQLSELRLARAIRLEPILEAIDAGRRGGATHITFLGGEPTIHKGFLEALGHAVAVGFEDIVIFTNGVMLPVPGFIDRVLALGRHFEWRISIQGANEAAHVAVTKRPDSFRRIVQGLETLRAQGQRVTANLCVNEESYRSLPDFPGLVQRYGIAQLHVDVIRPPSTGERTSAYLAEIMPRYGLMAPYMRRMLEGFDAWNPAFDVTIGNVPHCVLPEWASRIEHGGVETTTTSSDGQGLETPVDKYAWHGTLRRHVPGCDGCVFKPRCAGVFHEYLDLYGDEEFQAVTLSRLQALDPTGRNLVSMATHAFPTLFALALRTDIAQGWQGAGVVATHREGVAAARFRADGGHVEFRFSREREARRPVHVQGGVALELLSDSGVAASAVAALSNALVDAGALRDGSFGESFEQAVLQRVELDVRSAQLLETMLERATEPHPTWRVLTRSGGKGTSQGSIDFLAPDGVGRLRLELAVAPRDGRPNVSVRSQTGPGTHRAQALEQTKRLAALMRGRPDPR